MQNIKDRYYRFKFPIVCCFSLLCLVPMDVFPVAGICGQGLINVATVNVFASQNANEHSLVTGKFTVTRTSGLSKPITVSFLLSGSARNGIDFKQIVGSIHFEVGSSEKTVLVIPIDDAEVEGTETLTLIVSTGTGYILGNHISDTINIADNDTHYRNLQWIESPAFETLGRQSENSVNNRVTIYHSGKTQAEFSHGRLNQKPVDKAQLQTQVTASQRIKKPGIQSVHTVLPSEKLSNTQSGSSVVSTHQLRGSQVQSIPTVHPTRLVLIMICLTGLAWRSLSQTKLR